MTVNLTADASDEIAVAAVKNGRSHVVAMNTNECSSSSSSTSSCTVAETASSNTHGIPAELAAVAAALDVDLTSQEGKTGRSATRQLDLGFTSVKIQKEKLEKVLFGTVTAFFVMNAAMLPFVIPKCRRFLGAPFLPTKKVVVNSMFNSLETHLGPLKGRTLVDIGSGDGRIVLKASTDYGMNAVGYELNPYLALLSKFRCRRAPTAQIFWKNAWDSEKDVRQADVVTLYGRPGDKLMEKLGEYLEKTTKPDCVVVSNVFNLPSWERRLIEDKDGLKVYDKKMCV